ncbi:MAG: SDR family oxidoreductase [Phycisphaerae bacterium]|nr:SDR family oxidoreductase [Phycisphaerae bacterium]
MTVDSLFSVAGKKVVLTGGAGVLCRELAVALARRGASLVLIGRTLEKLQAVAEQCRQADASARVHALAADVTDESQLRDACRHSVDFLGGLDVLINGAGGNKREATARPDNPFFQIPATALREVFDLNNIGTMLPCQMFGEILAKQQAGNIVNFTSMAAFRPLTNVVGYAAAKAAISNFTQWLAVYMAGISPAIRVNAIAPGFFLTEQNRFLLTEQATGNLTPRGQAVIGHTPMKRFGEPADLIGALLYLVSDASRFVTGSVLAVDGGFNAFAGV